jgi:hypothetical protein
MLTNVICIMLIEDNQDDTIIIVSHKTNKSSILIKECHRRMSYQ